MIGDVPTWQTLDQMTSGLSEQGVTTIRWAHERLRFLLGESWLAKQYRKQARLPGELLLAGVHRSALPQFLSFVLRLDQASAEPTFGPVRRELKRGASSSDWRHTLLQLEVARAAVDAGTAATYEPAIPGSTRRADLLISGEGGNGWVVETTTIPRAAMDTAWEAYEERLRAAVQRIEREFDVTCLIDLNSHMIEDETEAWLNAVRLIAAHTDGEPGNQVVPSEIGTITICRSDIPVGTAVFAGAVQERDGWHRLGRTLSDKSQQVAGPLPAWIRVDCLDGLFQFTGWARMEAEGRLDAIAAEIRDRVAWSDNAEGVVLSSGPAFFGGGDDPAMAPATIATSAGTFLRRVVAPNLVRETFIVPLRAGVEERTSWWTHAYGNEPEWLDADLLRAGHPRLAELWKQGTFERTG